jgi:hypothetical protein
MSGRRGRQPGDTLTFTEAARREQITTLAIDLIAEHGYAGTSLAKIAEAAGLSNAAVLADDLRVRAFEHGILAAESMRTSAPWCTSW